MLTTFVNVFNYGKDYPWSIILERKSPSSSSLLSLSPEAYLEPSQVSTIDFFSEKVNGFYFRKKAPS